MALQDFVCCPSSNPDCAAKPKPRLRGSTTDVTTIGGSNGSIVLIPVTGYSIEWSGPSGYTNDNLFDIYNLIAGTYIATLIDKDGCSWDFEFEVKEPKALRIKLTSTNPIDCNSTTTCVAVEFLVGYEGTPAYTVVWTREVPNGVGGWILDPGFSFTTNGLTQCNLPLGRYTAAVTDSKGQTDSGNIIMSSKPVITDPTAINEAVLPCDGTVTLDATGIFCGGCSDPTYTYQWYFNGAPVGIGGTYAADVAGTYTVIATDCYGQKSPAAKFEVKFENDFAVDVEVTQPICNGDPGKFVATITSGECGAAVYKWFSATQVADVDFDCSQDPTSLAWMDTPPPVPVPGDYGLVGPTQTNPVANVVYSLYVVCNGCCRFVGTFVSTPPSAQTTTVVSGDIDITGPKCAGGSVTLIIGVPLIELQPLKGFTAIWKCQLSSCPLSPEESEVRTKAWESGFQACLPCCVDGDGISQYLFSLLDQNGCPVLFDGGAEFIVQSFTCPVPLDMNINVTPPKCFGGTDGKFDITVSGGVPGDTPGCSNTSYLPPPGPIGPANLYGVIIQLPNGSKYEYLTNASGVLTLDPATLSVIIGSAVTTMPIGTYHFTAVDCNNCRKEFEATMIEPNVPLIVSTTTTGLLCNSSGEACVHVDISGGLPEYTIAWEYATLDWNNAIIAGPLPLPSSANKTDYCFDQLGLLADVDVKTIALGITVTDRNGCVKVVEVAVVRPCFRMAEATVTDVTCFGEANGRIEITNICCITDGAFGTSTLNPITSTDNNTCPAGNPCGDDYTYTWKALDGSCAITDNASNSICNLPAGQYKVVIKDKRGCCDAFYFEVADGVQVVINNPTVVQPVCPTNTTGGSTTGSITNLIFSSMGVAGDLISYVVTGPNNFSLVGSLAANTAGANPISVGATLACGNYQVAATFIPLSGTPAGCSSQKTIKLNCLPNITVLAGAQTCYTAGSSTITLTTSGGTGALVTTITGGTGTATILGNVITVTVGGTLELTTTDASSCVAVNTITAFSQIAATGTIAYQCASDGSGGFNVTNINAGTLTVTGGVPNYQYEIEGYFPWQNNALFAGPIPVPTGTPTNLILSIHDTKGCERRYQFTVTCSAVGSNTASITAL